jgi:hypothetical protein
VIAHLPLMLLTSRSTSRHQQVFGGICLADTQLGEVPDAGWSAWLLGKDPARVKVMRHDVSFSQSETDKGCEWEVDGNTVVDLAKDEATKRLCRNRFIHIKFLPKPPEVLPVFIGPEPKCMPCCDTLLARIIPERIIDIPDARVELERMRSYFSPTNSAVLEASQNAERLQPSAGLVTPVEMRNGDARVRGALQLREKREAGVFKCMLYRADQTPNVSEGTVLYRVASRNFRDRVIRHESEIARVISVERTCHEIEPEGPGDGIVTHEIDGEIYPIVCNRCGTTFNAAQFSADQLLLIDLWSAYLPLIEDRSLLMRARAMILRHPESANAFSFKKFAWSSSGEPIDGTFKPTDEELDRWTGTDHELRRYVKRTSCNVERRLEWTEEGIRKQARRIEGRRVACTVCGVGTVALKDRDRY